MMYGRAFNEFVAVSAFTCAAVRRQYDATAAFQVLFIRVCVFIIACVLDRVNRRLGNVPNRCRVRLVCASYSIPSSQIKTLLKMSVRQAQYFTPRRSKESRTIDVTEFNTAIGGVPRPFLFRGRGEIYFASALIVKEITFKKSTAAKVHVLGGSLVTKSLVYTYGLHV